MMAGQYQGGPSVDVLSTQGKKAESLYKSFGSVKKVYDQSVKGFVLAMEGGRDVRLQLPPAEKESLGLIQPYLVLQMQVPVGKGVSFELSVLDQDKTRRRINLSTSACP